MKWKKERLRKEIMKSSEKNILNIIGTTPQQDPKGEKRKCKENSVVI